jgi:hypothetical protein
VAEAAHRANPEIAGALVESEGKDGPMGESVGSGEDFPFAVFEQRQAVLGACPNAIAVNQDAIDVIVGKPVGDGEVLLAEAGHVGRRGERQQREQQAD